MIVCISRQFTTKKGLNPKGDVLNNQYKKEVKQWKNQLKL